MSRPGSTMRRRAPRKLGDGRGRILLREQLEIELVGIIGPADGRPGWAAEDTVLLDGDEELLALVESLRLAGRPAGRPAPAAGAARSFRYDLVH